MVSRAWLSDVLDELGTGFEPNPVKVVISQRRTEAGTIMWKSTYAIIWMILGTYVLRVRMGFREEIGRKSQPSVLVNSSHQRKLTNSR